MNVYSRTGNYGSVMPYHFIPVLHRCIVCARYIFVFELDTSGTHPASYPAGTGSPSFPD